MQLPIESVLPSVKEALGNFPNAVLTAPPGSGKTTRVPVALCQEPWLAGRKILMLEPRRLAARAAARFMAASLGEQVGDTIGYRVRLDTKVSPKTKIEVITEGILTRIIQSDPALEGVGAVIFDEFHERSLHADLGLALCLQSQSLLRPELRILIMSATLDAAPVAALLGNAPVIESQGKIFPVETIYLDRRAEGPVEAVVARAVMTSLQKDAGDLLVFLPGAGEIRRVEARLRANGLDPDVRIAPLYGNLPQDAQDLAISPGRLEERKVVLATSIAETSLTVEGVKVVIDSGLMRIPRFSPRTGMTRLETVTVSRASADQRRGRAGRLGPGVCYRLWTKQEDRYLEPRTKPEILEADLAPLALELAAWGVQDAEELLWLDPPPQAAFAQARQLLYELGALDGDGKITPHGRRMAQSGLHPRLAHMILKAIPLGYGGLACELAALLGARDLMRSSHGLPDGDIRLRVEALHRFDEAKHRQTFMYQGFMVDGAACRAASLEASYLKREFEVPAKIAGDINLCGLLLAFAYPDRIGQHRGDGRFLLTSGRGAAFLKSQPLSGAAWLVAAELDDAGSESQILLAAPIDIEDLKQYFKDRIEREVTVAWDRAAQAVRARSRERLGALALKDTPIPTPDPDAALVALLQGIAEEGLEMLPWTRAAIQLRQRINFMHRLDPGWPDMSDASLAATLKNWLAPYVYGMSGRDDLQRLNLAGILESLLTWEQRRKLDENAPTHITVPSGQRIPVDYTNPDAPVLSVRLQEMFGLAETPAIADGRVPLTIHLLSPAHRPVQVTRDLASFWQSAYFEVKKELQGRYPKHYWPDDPLTAKPTNRTRPKQ